MKLFGLTLYESRRELAARVTHEVLEAIDLAARYVDPDERLRDDGQDWISGAADANQDISNFKSEKELADARNQARALAAFNPFAICGHENRISYIVGTGHTYKPVAKPDREVPDEWLVTAKTILDDFYEDSYWCSRQKETVRRFDRDGECFRRIFVGEDGIKIRFVEPAQVTTPKEHQDDPAHAFGVITDPRDHEDVQGYWVKYGNEYEQVSADELQHLKANVDCNVRRGRPTFWPARKMLWDAMDTLRNIGATSKIQTAIALIRRHIGGTQTGLSNKAATAADYIRTSPLTGKQQNVVLNKPGKIIDVNANTEYDFPASGINVVNYGEGVQAMLRSVAASVVQPEFMFTADASNANYASTMVAEGPAVKNFERLQAEIAAFDLEIMWLVLESAVERGELDGAHMESITIEVGKPQMVTRNKLEEAQIDEILARDHVISPQTRAARADLEYEQEQENLRKAAGGVAPETTTDATLPIVPVDGAAVSDGKGVPPLAADNVLNGAQLTAATAIVIAAAAGELPRDAALGQLQLLFKLSPQDAAALLGSAGTGVATKPNINPKDEAANAAAAEAAKNAPPKTAFESADIEARSKAWGGYPL